MVKRNVTTDVNIVKDSPKSTTNYEIPTSTSPTDFNKKNNAPKSPKKIKKPIGKN